MGSFKSIWSGLDWSVLSDVLLRVIPALLCITIHELCHGLTAYKLGDDTAKRAGRLTLNPLRHIDVMGLIMMLLFRFGWAKPVPVNMNRLRSPKRDMAFVALAGPLSNLLLAILALFLYGLLLIPLSRGSVGNVLLDLILTVASLSIALAIFNIIPIPPLDGSKILFSLLPENAYRNVLRYERYGMILLLLLVATNLLGKPLGTATSWVFSKLWSFAKWGFLLADKVI